MDELLRDPSWTFVGAVLAAVAIIIAAMQYISQRRKKSISYQEISISSLLSVNSKVAGKVKVLYEDQPVSSVSLVELRIFNSGNVPIESRDFESDIVVKYGQSSDILSLEVIHQSPSDLNIAVRVDNSSVLISPLLMNPGDGFTLKTLASSFNREISVTGRVSGVSAIRKYAEGDISFFGYAISSFLLIGIGLSESIQSVGTTAEIAGYEVSGKTIGVSILVIGYMIMFIGGLRNRKMSSLIEDVGAAILKVFRR